MDDTSWFHERYAAYRETTQYKTWVAYHECRHAQQELRSRTARNGTVQYKYQCLACGRSIGGALKKAEALALVPNPIEFDYGLRDSRARIAVDAGQELYQLKERAKTDVLDKENDEWWAWYNAYLQSPGWRRRRRLVLERAGGVCEGCREAPATQVHHLTYEHAGDELLFELVAICEECHDKIHRGRPEDAA